MTWWSSSIRLGMYASSTSSWISRILSWWHIQTGLLECPLHGATLEDDPDISQNAVDQYWINLGSILHLLDCRSCTVYQWYSGCSSRCWWQFRSRLFALNLPSTHFCIAFTTIQEWGAPTDPASLKSYIGGNLERGYSQWWPHDFGTLSPWRPT